MSTSLKGSSVSSAVDSTAKPKLHVELKMDALPSGIHFVAVKDTINTNVFYIPSHNNYFGPIKISNIICDSGCFHHLLAIPNGDLDLFFETFPETQYVFEVLTGLGTAALSPCILVKPVDKAQFPVRIGVDRFPDSCPAYLPRLRFHLSSEEASEICENQAHLQRFSSFGQEKLVEVAKDKVKRLPVSLLGNFVADQYDELKCLDVRFYVNFGQLALSFTQIHKLANNIKEVTRTQDPESFDALHAYAEFCFHDDLHSDDEGEDNLFFRF